MRHHRRFLFALGVLGFSTAAVTAVSCGSSGNSGSHSGVGGSTGSSSSGSGAMPSTGSTGTSMASGASSSTGGFITPDGGCVTAADCNGGVCNGGMCCPTAADICGTACCMGGTVCLNGGCVTPGNSCHTAGDCGPNEYCETALGGGSDGGVPDAGGDGGVCVQPLPLGGKCLPLPPVCPGDAGAPADGGCVADCEYHPPSGGPLNAVAKWSWGTNAKAFPNDIDVWSTPVVGRVYDSNCDGVVNELDTPVILFVSGNDLNGYPAGTNCQTANGNVAGYKMCQTGVLRMLDGTTGQEIWSLAKVPGSVGFAGLSIALGDIDGDGRVDIVAATGEGKVVMLDANGNLKRTSDKPVPGTAGVATWGWGGGLSIADMDNDGFPEIAYGSTVFTTTNGKITWLWDGANGIGSNGLDQALSTFVDLDGLPDNHLELVAGNTAYPSDYATTGKVFWHNANVTDGFPGVGDFNKDGKPDVVIIGGGKVWILNGLDGSILAGPATLPGTGSGGPPTVADFDGDGKPEIGVAMATFYSVMKPDFTTTPPSIKVLWSTPNHDLSSSVTGSTVFDFEGDGKAEVIYADECFLWVFNGKDGSVRFAAPHTSFTGTEASLVADVDGDGRAEIVMITNGASPAAGAAGWDCLDVNGNPVTINGVKWTPSTLPNKSYRGIVVFGDSANAWVGTRTLWNQHAYHVSNICDDRDSACPAPNVYGSIPKVETKNWTLPWLNNFRQNVQDKGIFNAPDVVVDLNVVCGTPATLIASVRNIGLASLPANVGIGLYKGSVAAANQVGMVTTTHTLLPGQTEQLSFSVPPNMGSATDTYLAQVIIPTMPTFHECNANNNTSAPATGHCVQ